MLEGEGGEVGRRERAREVIALAERTAANVFSVGDIVIAVGLAVALHRLAARPSAQLAA